MLDNQVQHMGLTSLGRFSFRGNLTGASAEMNLCRFFGFEECDFCMLHPGSVPATRDREIDPDWLLSILKATKIDTSQ